MAFDSVLSPESASFAGQAAISMSLACQNTPEPVAGPISPQGPQVPPPVGKPYCRMQLLTVQKILEGKRFDTPGAVG